MKRALTASEVRAVEARSAELGLPVAVLMENAGTALAEAALRLAEPHGRFLVVCGTGNNGGDGLVATRKLALQGRQVHVELVGDRTHLSPEATRTLSALRTVQLEPAPLSAGWPVRSGDVVVDALFGTGLSRPPSAGAAEAVARIAGWRAAGARVVSADLPSGLPSDGAPPYTPCVQADVTVAFGALKLGHLTAAGADHCGKVELAAIGFPPVEDWPVVGPGVFLLEASDVRQTLRPRAIDSNKGSFGHVLVVAGGPGKTGAASLCAQAVLRSGAGLCTVASRPEALNATMASAPELMGHPLAGGETLTRKDAAELRRALAKKSAWVVGPGIPRGPGTGDLLVELLADTPIACVLDADALNALVGHLDTLHHAAGPLVLTPHPGEMARLLETDVAAVQADRMGAARALAARCKATVVLKGALTLIAAPDGRVFVNPTGNPGLATGGTGDVLAGICAGLLAQGLLPLEGACAAVYAHGHAADLAAELHGEAGLVASDVVQALGRVWVEWER